MGQTTEIYSIRGDESLREGALEYSDRIDTRADAEADAAARCQRDRTIRKVAYYLVDEAGDFRVLTVYQNPDPVIRRSSGKQAARRADPGIRQRPGHGRRETKPGLFDRIMDFLKE